MKVGVIGIGGFASQIIDGIKKHPHFDIAYGYHPIPAKAHQWDSTRGTADLNKLLKSKKIQAIFVLTPTHHHFEYCRKAIEAGKHVFVEKPLTHTLEDARKLKQYLKKDQLKFFVGHNFRRKPWHRQIKAIIDSGRLGKIFSLIINKSHGAAFQLPPDSWRKDIAAQPEGPLATVGVHFFDLIHYWFKEVDEVNAVLSNVSQLGASPDANAVLLKLRKAVTVYLQTNYCQCSEDFIHIYGTEGTVYCQDHRLFLRSGRDVDRLAVEPQEVPLGKDNAIVEELEEFYQSIISNKPIETGFTEGFDCLCLLDACRRSHELGEWIKLSQYMDYFEETKAKII